MVAYLMMSAKLATLGLLKWKILFKKDYDVVIFVHGVNNKFLLRDSNYLVDEVMWPKFGKSSISMREIIVTSILYRFDQKEQFFREVLFVQVQ